MPASTLNPRNHFVVIQGKMFKRSGQYLEAPYPESAAIRNKHIAIKVIGAKVFVF